MSKFMQRPGGVRRCRTARGRCRGHSATVTCVGSGLRCAMSRSRSSSRSRSCLTAPFWVILSTCPVRLESRGSSTRASPSSALSSFVFDQGREPVGLWMAARCGHIRLTSNWSGAGAGQKSCGPPARVGRSGVARSLPAPAESVPASQLRPSWPSSVWSLARHG